MNQEQIDKVEKWQYCILRPDTNSDHTYIVGFYDQSDGTPILKQRRFEQGLAAACHDLLRDGWQYIDRQSDPRLLRHYLQFKRPLND